MVGAIGSSSEPRLGVGVTLCDPGQQPITSAIHRSLHGGTRRRRGERVGFVVGRMWERRSCEVARCPYGCL